MTIALGRPTPLLAQAADAWRCGACLRAFSVRLIATGVTE